jgi:hypothetical protein
MPQSDPARESTIFCNRCLRLLQPGAGDFYEVSILSIRDPSPPLITAEDLERDPTQTWRELLNELANTSPREALDQVYRQVTVHLCDACHASWIEDPAGCDKR